MATTTIRSNTARSASISSTAPDSTAVVRVAIAALQSRSVAVERLDGYLHRTYRLRTCDRFFYLLRCRPLPGSRLLRLEDGGLLAEAAALHTLAGSSVGDAAVPRLIASEIHHGAAPSSIRSPSGDARLGAPYLISGPFVGSILADVEPTLSAAMLASIDASLGQFVRSLSSLKGPRFGFVMTPPSPTGGSSSSLASSGATAVTAAVATPGFDSWSRAFAFFLESVLRDAEDVTISLPYDTIRDLVRRHRAALDHIVSPRLTLLETSADSNVAVDVPRARVTGLLDYSSAVWGDPFMSDCFYRPTASFAKGFGRLPNASLDERIRQYLYVLYHSLIAIVRHCYRPSKDDSGEKEARKNLTAAMRQLDSLAKHTG